MTMAAGEPHTPIIPADLMVQLENVARQQGRATNDLIAEALKRYLDERAWRNLIGSAAQSARSMGLSEDDVPRLIAEYRSERASEG
jgi:metal-responsive CopG/Arc/MetJ family transcriptional regulator